MSGVNERRVGDEAEVEAEDRDAVTCITSSV